MLEAQCKAVRPDFLSAKSTEACESNEKKESKTHKKDAKRWHVHKMSLLRIPCESILTIFWDSRKQLWPPWDVANSWIGVLMTLMTSCKRSSFAWCAGDTFVLLKAKALSKRYFKWRSLTKTHFTYSWFASVPPEQTFNLVLQLPWHNRRNYQHSAVLSQDLSWLRPGPSVRSWRWKHKTKNALRFLHRFFLSILFGVGPRVFWWNDAFQCISCMDLLEVHIKPCICICRRPWSNAGWWTPCLAEQTMQHSHLARIARQSWCTSVWDRTPHRNCPAANEWCPQFGIFNFLDQFWCKF